MYKAYWGLQRSPFGSETARAALVASPVQAEALARLDFLLSSKSRFGLLLGPAGSGKSAVLAEFARNAERSGALASVLSAGTAEEQHLLIPLALGLQVAAARDGWQLWQSITDRLQELKLDGLPALVLFDDLDRAAASALLLVERLLAIPDSPLTIVAAARPDKVQRLGARIVEQADLRIDLTPWSETEAREYLLDSLARAGRHMPAFDLAATRRLFELSGGAPRRLNQLAHLALVAGAGQKLNQIDAGTIEAVQEELSLAR
jgi:type II secretory pathway predicted ATPase ExeA